MWEASTAVPPAGPTAEILFPSEATSVPQGGEIRYVGSATSAVAGGTVTYRWSWGDQTADSTGASALHAYTRFGTYTVRLTDAEYLVTYKNVKTGKTFSVEKPAGSFAGGSNKTDLKH